MKIVYITIFVIKNCEGKGEKLLFAKPRLVKLNKTYDIINHTIKSDLLDTKKGDQYE